MNTKHTPAPWEARIDQIGIDIIQSKSGFGITQIGNYYELRKANYPIEIAEANAKLIAAAPELLEALMPLVNFCSAMPKDIFSQMGLKDLDYILNKSKDAIKKATE